jgi:hypothetical protein
MQKYKTREFNGTVEFRRIDPHRLSEPCFKEMSIMSSEPLARVHPEINCIH